MIKEIFKDIPNYKGLYQISNLGRVKGLKRKVSGGSFYYYKPERILKQTKGSRYFLVNLSKKNKGKVFQVHQLVAMAFLNHTPNGFKIVVDHIDNNPLNNNLDNLQLITQRGNLSKEKRGTSKHTGVYWNKVAKTWYSQICFNKKRKHIGVFKTEKEAANAYNNKLKQIKKDGFL